ncbi:segregation/condensation protein A [Nicoliella spurrieriana]|uniref:Segregation and condensation protein A n=1 Tax=Nicoliella spurrieriana TaxID=2925830 RepID=A0A976RS07_9LACO|nr:segregation/condensation protein A [Nicoliella spurrieriana]UQS86556.1 segregation/condensation protein A [Nicoliella spurrieriana]
MSELKQPFLIHINEFDGPLELLLHLIKQSKMSIYDIQIEAITKQYVDYLDRMKALNIDLVSEYFVMASNLMAIKSKLLLPSVSNDEDDDSDPRNELMNQLIVYQVYKKHADDLKQRYVQRAQLHSRPELVPSYANGLIDSDSTMDIDLIRTAMLRVVNNHELESQNAVEVSEWQYSVDEQTGWLIDQLELNGHLNLVELFSQQLNREALVTTFLAVLEMIKQQQIKVSNVDGEMTICKTIG